MLIVKLLAVVIIASVGLKISKKVRKGYIKGKRAVRKAKYQVASIYALASFPFYNEIYSVIKYVSELFIF